MRPCRGAGRLTCASGSTSPTRRTYSCSRPLIAALAGRRPRGEVTARDFAQSLELLRALRARHTAIGRTAADGVGAKAPRPGRALGRAHPLGAAARALRPRRRARLQRRAVAARLLRIPAATMFDYEWRHGAARQVNCRLARAVVVPDAIPPAAAPRGTGPAPKLAPVPGAEGGVLPGRLRPRPGGPRPARPRSRAAARRRPHAAGRLALPPLREPAVRRRARALRERAQTVVLARTPEQRAEPAAPVALRRPRAAVDAPCSSPRRWSSPRAGR